MGHKSIEISLILICILLHSTSSALGQNECDEGACTPAADNLLIGRENRLTASSTCGLSHPESFCLVTDTNGIHNICMWCDSRHKDSNRWYHGVENMVSKDGQDLWWQSQSGIENVTIQLDLETTFHLMFLYLKFKSIRPAEMLVEISADNGRTWQVVRYYAHDCRKQFPLIPQESAIGSDPTTPYCTEAYSTASPHSGGQVTFSSAKENFSAVEFTNLRVSFTKFHNITDKGTSFYAIEQMAVMGTCACNGHASQCIPQDGASFPDNMVHGKCKCDHKTAGSHCEKCEDLYNDLAWAPASRKQKKECNKCNCNDHATSCHFDPTVFNSTGQVSGGVCDDCQHNTVGYNCEHCQEFFYRDSNRSLTDPNVCLPCDCDLAGSLNQGNCDMVSGQCYCKLNVEGRRCDTRKPDYSNFAKNNWNRYEHSLCNPLGTLGDRVDHAADPTECICKSNVIGVKCDQCDLKYWGLDDSPLGCRPCHCDPGGSVNEFCDVLTGQCRCRPHLIGRTCKTAEPSYYTRPLNYQFWEAEVNTHCLGAWCYIEVRPNWVGMRPWWTGPGYLRMNRDTVLSFPVEQIASSTEFNAFVRYELQAFDEDGDSTVRLTLTLLIHGKANPTGFCAGKIDSLVREVTLRPGSLHTETESPFCLEAYKNYSLQLQLTRHNKSGPIESVLIDSVLLAPKIESIPFMIPGPPLEHGRLDDFKPCRNAIYSITDDTLSELCKAYHFSIGAYIYGGAYPCQCHPAGSYNSTCERISGKCYCLPNVTGHKCDTCSPASYGFGPNGCTACDCHSNGSLDNFCNQQDGQCNCKANVVGRNCDRCQPGWCNFPACQRCTCDDPADTCNHLTGVCIECKNSTDGSNCEK